jgi:hypothetical protein
MASTGSKRQGFAGPSILRAILLARSYLASKEYEMAVTYSEEALGNVPVLSIWHASISSTSS